MNKDSQQVLLHFSRIILYGIVMLFVAEVIAFDAGEAIEIKYQEHSWTERFQELFLFLSGLIALYLAASKQEYKAGAFAFAGFFFMSFIREFNNYLKTYAFDGAWQLGVYSVLAITVYMVWKHRSKLRSNILAFFADPSSGVFVAGLLVTHFFSRLFGRTEFWKTVMGSDYTRSVKNGAEEGIELLGYALMLIGFAEWVWRIHKKKNPAK